MNCTIQLSENLKNVKYTCLLKLMYGFWTYDHFHNILRPFDVLLNFPFTTSEAMRNYYYKRGIYELPHELLKDLRLSA